MTIMDLPEARKTGARYKLNAPEEYWMINIEGLANIIGKGGCGPGKTGDKVVPDTVWFLSIRPACAIHDFEYSIMMNEKDREKADGNFLLNMMKLINKQTKFFLLRMLRRRRALKYYEAVRAFGGKK